MSECNSRMQTNSVLAQIISDLSLFGISSVAQVLLTIALSGFECYSEICTYLTLHLHVPYYRKLMFHENNTNFKHSR